MKRFAAGFLVLPNLLASQTVHGRVTDRASKDPVMGAIIQLLDSGGKTVSRALTNERGEFWVSGPVAGAYRVRSLRIGFRPEMSATLTLGVGEMVELPLAIASLPVSLDTVRIASHNSCRALGDTVVATYAIWEQVRAALAAAQLTASSQELTANTMSYERVMDPTFKAVRKQSTVFGRALTGSPWRSMRADSLRAFGYVINDVTGARVYLAPDLEVLQSAEFLEDHCLRLSRSSTDGLIGIEFEPNKDRSTLAEISGTVWVDRGSAELRRMEFKYENLSVAESDARPGGQLEFLRLKSGGWAIMRWNIRMPVMATVLERSSHQSAVGQLQQRVNEVRVAGGELVSVVKGEDTTWARTPMSFSGEVIDSTSRERLSGAHVSLLGTSLGAITDKDGRFLIVNVLPGEYELEVTTASLDSIWARYSMPVSVVEGATRTRFNVPSADERAMRFCPFAEDSSNATAFLIGTVRIEGDTAPPWNVVVNVAWGDGKDPSSAVARTDAFGRYRLCGVPRGSALSIRTELDDTAAAPLIRRVPARKHFLVADVTVPKPQVAAGSVFVGNVVENRSGQPLVDAEVTVDGVNVTVRTNSQGRFRITGVPGGTHRVSARKVGYASPDTSLVFANGQATRRTFALERVATLDVVTANARALLPDFEENRRLGLGHFLTRADLAKAEGRGFLAGTLAELPGTDVVSAFGNRAYLRSSRVPREAPIVGGNQDNVVCIRPQQCYCFSQVYIDGVLMNPGRPTPPFDVNTDGRMRAHELEAVEYYASAIQLPMKYARREATCGVYVFHTRKSSF